jgi:hypothetical protein
VDGDQLSDTRSDLLAARLRQGPLAGDILRALRQEFGAEVPGVWSATLEAAPPEVLPSGWYEEDTVLGDLLRLVQQLQHDRNQELPLDPNAGGSGLPRDICQRICQLDAGLRESLLRRVAILGVDVLRGDRVLSEEISAATGG